MYSFIKPKRTITRIFIHCTAYGRGDMMGATLLKAVNSWHVARGWSKIGYHFLIDRSGLLIPTYRSLEENPIAQANNNSRTIAISLDGLAETDFNIKQFATLRELADQIDKAYGSSVTYHGHCEVANKACPVFDYKAVLGLDSKGYRNGQGINIQAPEVTSLYTPEPAIGKRVLRKTCKGSDVEFVQKALGIRVDGLFGRMTYRAVVAFQKLHNLYPDGVVGKNTWRALLALNQ